MSTLSQDQINAIFKQNHEFYLTIKEHYEKTNYYDTYPLSEHWLLNMQSLVDIIFQEKDPLKRIEKIHQTVMYSINTSDEELKALMVKWYVDFMNNQGTPLSGLDPSIAESPYSNPYNSSQQEGRLVSPDFLRTVLLALEVKKYCDFPDGKFCIMELGAGYGQLARSLKLFFPQITSVITDIPETMFFSSCYLRLNFPDAKFKYITDPDQFKEGIEQYDFVFVPTKFAHGLVKFRFELFYNTASLGEMRNEVIRYWMDFVQNKGDFHYFFGLNRFLNTIDLAIDEWRFHENTASCLFDGRWNIKKWELDPPLARCPYLETLVSRNLQIIVERIPKDQVNQQEQVKESAALLKRVEKEDWFTRPFVRDAVIQFDSSDWPIRSTRGDQYLVPDFSDQGTLYAIWRSISLDPNVKNIQMMITYLEFLEGKRPFEEVFFYKEWLCKLKGEPIPQWIQEKPKPSKLREVIKSVTTPGMRQWLKRLYNGV